MLTLKPAKGHLLVSEPSVIRDVSFNRSVILLADHSEHGTIGFILNKQLGFSLTDLIPDIKGDFDLYRGGPVDSDNLYFIHKVPDLIPKSVEIASGIYWGGNFEAVKELIEEELITQEEIKFFLGYSGWENEQLVKELNARNWVLIEKEDESDIINHQPGTYWKDKMLQLGSSYAIWSNAPENPSSN